MHKDGVWQITGVVEVLPKLCYTVGVIVDFHTHIVPPGIKNNPEKYVGTDPCFTALYSSPKPKLATAEELIASMDREGVQVSVALNIAWSNHELCIETNDYIMESVARYPGRIVGFGAVSFQSLDLAISEVERCARGGLKGIGELRPDRQLLEDDSLLETFVDALTRNNLIMLTHASEPVGHIYPGKGDITPDKLYPLMLRFPALKLVCAHWGGGLPFYALMPEVKRAMSNVYFDTAASAYLYTPQIYIQVAQIAGADKVLFGTDYPLLPPGRLLREIRSLSLPQETERLILSGNACRLLGINTSGKD